jgi:signal recognition particle subunit SRP54
VRPIERLPPFLQGHARHEGGLVVEPEGQSPAAIEQLRVLGRQLEIPVFDSRPDADPVEICREAIRHADLNGYDTVLLTRRGGCTSTRR